MEQDERDKNDYPHKAIRPSENYLIRLTNSRFVKLCFFYILHFIYIFFVFYEFLIFLPNACNKFLFYFEQHSHHDAGDECVLELWETASSSSFGSRNIPHAWRTHPLCSDLGMHGYCVRLTTRLLHLYSRFLTNIYIYCFIY